MMVVMKGSMDRADHIIFILYMYRVSIENVIRMYTNEIFFSMPVSQLYSKRWPMRQSVNKCGN